MYNLLDSKDVFTWLEICSFTLIYCKLFVLFLTFHEPKRPKYFLTCLTVLRLCIYLIWEKHILLHNIFDCPIRAVVITFYSPNCLRQETANGPFDHWAKHHLPICLPHTVRLHTDPFYCWKSSRKTVNTNFYSLWPEGIETESTVSLANDLSIRPRMVVWFAFRYLSNWLQNVCGLLYA